MAANLAAHHIPANAIDPVQLPGVLAELQGVVGLTATLRITECWGGTRLYVPSSPDLTDGHPLVEKLGWEAATRLRASLKIPDPPSPFEKIPT